MLADVLVAPAQDGLCRVVLWDACPCGSSWTRKTNSKENLMIGFVNSGACLDLN